MFDALLGNTRYRVHLGQSAGGMYDLPQGFVVAPVFYNLDSSNLDDTKSNVNLLRVFAIMI